MATHPFQNFLVRYGAGERIFSEGDLGTTMFIVQSGKVRLFRIVDGVTRVHGTMEKGDFFGEMSILEGMPRTMAAEAVEDSELIEINGTTFDKMIKGNIEIAIRMLRKLSLRLREAERRLEEMPLGGGLGTATMRAVAPSPPRGAKKVDAGVRLEIEGEAGGGFPLSGTETLLGRYDPVTDQRPDIDLTDVDLKRSVSRRHARIVRTDQGWTITEEVGALNGTSINGVKLVTGKPHPLAEGDRVGLGTVRLVFRT